MGIFQEVSNWVLGSYKVRTTQATDGAQYQHVRLDVGAGTAESQVTAANPLPITGGASGLGVDIQKYGGTSTTLGQKAEAASIPVVLATEQDSVETWTDDFSSTRYDTIVGGLTSDNVTTRPIGIDGSGQVYSVATVSGLNASSLPRSARVFDTAPAGTEAGLVTRNIPSGTQDVSIASLPALPANQSVNVAQMNGVAVTMGNGASGTGVQRVTLASDSTGQAKALLYDSAGNAIASAITTPSKSDRGAVVRNIPITARQRDAAGGLAELCLPHGYYSVTSRTTTSGSTTTVINVTVDPSTAVRKGDILYQNGGTFAQGLGQWAVIDSVNSSSITLEATGFGVAPPTTVGLTIYRPRWLLTDSNGQLLTVSNVYGTISTTPIATNKTYFESGSMDYTSITNSITAFYTTSNQGYMCEISNTTDVELGYSLDTGGSEHFIPAGQVSVWNLMDIGGYFPGGDSIMVYYPGPSAPTRGRISFMLAYY